MAKNYRRRTYAKGDGKNEADGKDVFFAVISDTTDGKDGTRTDISYSVLCRQLIY